MTILERLQQLVAVAPAGTLVPVESIATLLDEDKADAQQARTALSLEDVAARAGGELFGGRLTPGVGAVRKWIREGKDGVQLEAFGRPYVVTEQAWTRFVEQLQAKGKEQRPAAAAPAIAPNLDAADRIAAYEDQAVRAGQRGKGA